MHYTITVQPNKKGKTGEPDRPNYHHHHLIKSFNFPDDITQRRFWFIRYWVAKIQCRFPRHNVRLQVCPYYPEFENDAERIRKQSIAATKAQITRIEGLIEERKKTLSGLLFGDHETDPVICMANIKLERQKSKLACLIYGENNNNFETQNERP